MCVGRCEQGHNHDQWAESAFQPRNGSTRIYKEESIEGVWVIKQHIQVVQPSTTFHDKLKTFRSAIIRLDLLQQDKEKMQ